MKVYIHNDLEFDNYPYNFYIGDYASGAEQTWDLSEEIHEKHQKWLDFCKFTDVDDVACCLEALGGKRIK